eukprot:5471970-Amphidinium_carterae.1
MPCVTTNTPWSCHAWAVPERHGVTTSLFAKTLVWSFTLTTLEPVATVVALVTYLPPTTIREEKSPK